MDTKDFMFIDDFRDITDTDIAMAYTRVEGLFTGVKTLWSPELCALSPLEIEGKRSLCYNYLVAWQLLSTYPTKGKSSSGMGAMPIKSKSINGLSLTYQDTLRQKGALSLLTTNVYGIQALEMIQTAPENFVIYT